MLKATSILKPAMDAAMMEKHNKEEHLKAKSRKLSVKEGSCFSVMDGFALQNVTPFALAIGATNAEIGLLTSIPSLVANFAQLWTAKAMERWPRTRMITLGVFLQAVMWLPILCLGVLYFVFDIHAMLPTVLILFYTLLMLFGSFIGPAWTSLMSELVTTNSGKYFGTRNRICGAVSLVALVIGGIILDHFKAAGMIIIGFGILFFTAFIARSVSAYTFTRMYEPTFKPSTNYYFSFKDFVKQMRHNNFGRFAIFDALITFAVNIGSPFVAVYMLSNLHFSYTIYTIIGVGSSVATLVFMPVWGKFADRYGNLTTMKITGWFVPLVMVLWALSPLVVPYGTTMLVVYLFLTNILSGFAWSGFNLSTTNFLYDAVTRERIGLCAAYTNILNGLSTFIGALLGGILASMVMPFGISAIIGVFIISAILRFASVIWMQTRVKEVRPVQPFSVRVAREKLIALSPEKVLRYFDFKS